MSNQANLVYLDHHIRREPLLYKSSDTTAEATSDRVRLALGDLREERGLQRQLRKPDFQRATQSWSAEDCAGLLDSVINKQVVPSVILWLSPDNFIYVLDGGHRISVLLAWMKDDWGDKDTSNLPLNEIVPFRQAAQEVRHLLQVKHIDTYEAHIAASDRYWELEKQFREDPELIKEQMSIREWELATRVRGWLSADVGFPIQWVVGDYNTAERSFLKINTTGTRLSPWEMKLVQARQSSFVRMVMSLHNPRFAERCWPVYSEAGKRLPDHADQQRQQIVEHVRACSNLLFEPLNSVATEINRPLLVIPPSNPEKGPLYTAEVLTVVHGMQGQEADMEALMEQSSAEDAISIIAKGLPQISELHDALKSFRGQSSLSLSLVSPLYFYTDEGRYVRSLFYGFLYWMNYGEESDIRSRKTIFSAHRRAFETILRRHKGDIVHRISRRIGSGSEVTLRTAHYFDDLLRNLVAHSGNISSQQFQVEHETLLEKFGSETTRSKERAITESPGRVYRGQQRQRIQLKNQLDSLPECPICGGLLNSALHTEIDHYQEHSRGGRTSDDNARVVHPFCNNNRMGIEQLKSGAASTTVPTFIQGDVGGSTSQMSFLVLWGDGSDKEESNEEELGGQEELWDNAEGV